MKIYKFVGNGLGVPGLPHKIERSVGDQWIEDFEESLAQEKVYTAKIYQVSEADLAGPFKAQQMPGAILKGALANGNYKKATVKDKPKDPPPATEPSSEEPPEEKENK